MSKKKATEKQAIASNKSQELQPLPYISGGEALFDLEKQAFIMANEFVNKIIERVDEAVTVMETTTIIPDYNANLAVMLAMTTASLKVLTADARVDDQLIAVDDEVEP